MIAPFFAAAHALTRWTNLSPDGFTPYYQHGAGLAGLCYVVAGLWFLKRLLERYFSSGVTSATLVALLAGTSLYHYATFDSVWSHAFSFALFCAFLERFDARRPGRLADGVVLGAISGLLILVRHTNALIPICFFGVDALRTRSLPLIPAIVATIVVLPQLWLYHRATGHWLISAYGSLGFTFDSPHLTGVLVSPRKGLFFYAPLLLLALPGLAALPDRLRQWRAPLAMLLVLNTYLIASWWDWQFGASYGHRGFVDFYPAFALGLAVAFAYASSRRPLRIALTCAVTLLCALSLFQMFQDLAQSAANGRCHLAAVPRHLPAMAMTRRLGIAAVLVVLGGTLWYLRDPPWLPGQTTGLRGWQREPDGSAYRWSGGHASFFVPADARQVRIPVATTFDARGPRGFDPMLVTFTIDDVRAGRALLIDPATAERHPRDAPARLATGPAHRRPYQRHARRQPRCESRRNYSQPGRVDLAAMLLLNHMRAIEIASPGGPEVLRVVQRPIPEPAAGEVLVRVATAGVNRPDIMQRMGKYPPPPGVTDIPGLELAGEVVDARGVTTVATGQIVCALVAGGAYAEYLRRSRGAVPAGSRRHDGRTCGRHS